VARRRRKRKENNSTKRKIRDFPDYPEDLIMAVKYLVEKGFNSRQIAERLDISPYTARNIKVILRRRGLIKDETSKPKEVVVKAKSKKSKDVIEEILGGE